MKRPPTGGRRRQVDAFSKFAARSCAGLHLFRSPELRILSPWCKSDALVEIAVSTLGLMAPEILKALPGPRRPLAQDQPSMPSPRRLSARATSQSRVTA